MGVTVTFSEAVDVDTSGGTPSIGIGLGGTAARSATYASGTGTTELVFEYTLVSGDGSHGYMAVTPDSLALNGGTIRSAGSGVDALLAHNGALTSGNSGRSTGPEVRFEDVPTGHDGETAFTVALRFGGVPEGLTQATVEGALLEVTGGRVTAARQTAEGGEPRLGGDGRAGRAGRGDAPASGTGLHRGERGVHRRAGACRGGRGGGAGSAAHGELHAGAGGA